jgi:hypothetical protein
MIGDEEIPEYYPRGDQTLADFEGFCFRVDPAYETFDNLFCERNYEGDAGAFDRRTVSS